MTAKLTNKECKCILDWEAIHNRKKLRKVPKSGKLLNDWLLQCDFETVPKLCYLKLPFLYIFLRNRAYLLCQFKYSRRTICKLIMSYRVSIRCIPLRRGFLNWRTHKVWFARPPLFFRCFRLLMTQWRRACIQFGWRLDETLGMVVMGVTAINNNIPYITVEIIFSNKNKVMPQLNKQ